MVATSCDLKAPRCTTIAPPVRLHGPRGGVFVGHRPPPGPRWPPAYIYIYIYDERWDEVLRLFRRSTHTHPAPSRACCRQMKWRWGWQGNESEMRMKMGWKLLNRNPGRGTHKKKRRNQERTPTPTHLARSGRTLKRQGKRKSGGRRKNTKTSGGGGRRKRLNQPKTPAKTRPT